MTVDVVSKEIESISDLELHDAIIDKVEIDLKRRWILLIVRSYLTSESKARAELGIEFSEVMDVSGILDFLALEDNSRSGNINYWVPSTEKGKTFLYFSDGCLAINACGIRARVIKPEPSSI